MIGGLDLASALPRDLDTFRYPGSLITSPDTEGVSWLVLRHHRSLSSATVDAFR
ncbi:MAG: carbonic anhydrase family protein, partial [Pseudonocardia sp.]|nr:carbonic anhydrase family protein [Pseudonocardia sp.]